MSLEYKDCNVTITCDKCGHSQTEKEGPHNDRFSDAGWGLYPRAKKYIHKCRGCMPPKDRRALDWAKGKFGHLVNQKEKQ
jgi:hypothetical protein